MAFNIHYCIWLKVNSEYYTVLHLHKNIANTSLQLNGNYNMHFPLFLIAYRVPNTEFVNIKLFQLIKRQSCRHIETSQLIYSDLVSL